MLQSANEWSLLYKEVMRLDLTQVFIPSVYETIFSSQDL